MAKKKSEHALALIRAGISGVPMVGGPIASLIGDYVPTATQRSIEKALADLKDQLAALQDRIDASHVDKDQFSELFKSAYLVIARTHHHGKLHAAARLLANLLLREGDAEKLSYTELDHYARCLEALSVGAIDVLGHAVSLASRTEPENLASRSSSLTFGQLHERLPDMDPSLLMGLVGELDSLNLMHRPGAPTVRTPDYENYPLELTPLGVRFTLRVLELDL